MNVQTNTEHNPGIFRTIRYLKISCLMTGNSKVLIQSKKRDEPLQRVIQSI